MLVRKLNSLRRLFASLGVRAATQFVWHHILGRGEGSEYWIHPKGAAHPLCIRRNASDAFVFKQIFVYREYGCLSELEHVRLVIDCGANVGYSSTYFLSAFPQCSIIAVEPDPSNFAMLQRNVAAYGNRAKCVRAGVWSQTAPLALAHEQYRDGSDWTKQVRLCEPDEAAEFEGVDVGSLLAASGHERISLLKIDVEGAEVVIFSENYEGWLDKVDAIAIELHDDSTFGRGSEAFFSAIEGRGFEISRSGELTICR